MLISVTNSIFSVSCVYAKCAYLLDYNTAAENWESLSKNKIWLEKKTGQLGQIPSSFRAISTLRCPVLRFGGH